MITSADRELLQAGFDGELDAGEWTAVQQRLADSPEAAELLAELQAMAELLDSAGDVAVPTDLAESIKARIPERALPTDTTVITGKFNAGSAAPRQRQQWAYGLALAASLVLALGLGVVLLDGPALNGHDPDRMKGTLVERGAVVSRAELAWPGLATSWEIVRSKNGFTLELEADSDQQVAVLLSVPSDQWRWRQEAAGATTPDSSATGATVQRLELQGSGSYRLPLQRQPGNTAAALPLIRLQVERQGEIVHESALLPGS